MARLRAYLAGPDVFLPDPLAFARLKKEICARHGLEGVFPLDAQLPSTGLDSHELGLAISRANEELIRSCQLLIAHLTPFRGPSADAGTAFEMGYARARGLPVFAYTNVAEDFATRTAAFVDNVRARSDGQLEDGDHMQIESFGLVDNLMLAGAIAGSQGCLVTHRAAESERYTALEAFEQCVVEAARVLLGCATP